MSTAPRASLFRRLSGWLRKCPKNREELIYLLQAATRSDILSPEMLGMIESVMRVSLMQVRDVMVPASTMVVVDCQNTLDMVLSVVVESGHSRFPVRDGQEVKGILLAKDLLEYTESAKKASFRVQDVLRPAFFVPQSKRLDVLLRDFRARRNHLAMVVDEYGQVAGLITIEDVLEQIVGEIEDEYDTDSEDNIRKRGDHHFLVRAVTPINDFNRFFGTDFPDAEFDTVGGLVLKALGHFPKRGESVTIDSHDFRVLHADSRRIRLLEVKKHKQENR